MQVLDRRKAMSITPLFRLAFRPFFLGACVLATLAIPLWLLALGGPLGAWLFAVMHGMGNGILTIAKGTLPLVFFGPQGYGLRQGWIMAPSRVAQAFAPLLFGLCIERWGSGALWVGANGSFNASIYVYVNLRAVGAYGYLYISNNSMTVLARDPATGLLTFVERITAASIAADANSAASLQPKPNTLIGKSSSSTTTR